MMGKILIDGDIIAYRAGFSSNDLTATHAESKVDELISKILEDTEGFAEDNYEVYLTGKGNFRFDVAKTLEYKGNRKDAVKPIHLKHIREYMVSKYEATVSEGEEADDLIAIEATKVGMNAVVASIDKDMLQIPCFHYNITRKELSAVGKFTGLKFFYTQILTGDKADNIKGLYRCGPVKANKILAECDTEMELWDTCVEAYEGDADRVIENARLLWLRREENELWEPPVEQDKISES
jgi:5'-3' exonuclease